MMKRLIPQMLTLMSLASFFTLTGHGLEPYEKNSFYWQLDGEPVVLLGGSVEDNLFQIDRLEEQLELLSYLGGNYIRCTMSSRDEGNVWAFAKNDESGLYDLNKMNPEYWDRFAKCLALAEERGVVVQIEVWDRFDFSREPWQDNPFNPKLNSNYDTEASGMKTKYPNHPGKRDNPFFRSVPELGNNEVLLPFQKAFVDKLLSISLKHDNVLYCMDNETNESAEWGAFWAKYIQAKAKENEKTVYCTEMWDAWDLNNEEHERTWKHPELYGFIDVSQNNHQVHYMHYENLLAFRNKIKETGIIRPLNTVKTYGANSGNHGTTRDGQERFWRSLFGGVASARFHRPPAGHGIGELAQAHLRSAKMFTDRFPFYDAEPAPELLDSNARNEAYCSKTNDGRYALFFPDGGDVKLKPENPDKTYRIIWVDIRSFRWQNPGLIKAKDGYFILETPRPEGYYAALLEPYEN